MDAATVVYHASYLSECLDGLDVLFEVVVEELLHECLTECGLHVSFEEVYKFYSWLWEVPLDHLEVFLVPEALFFTV